MVNKAYVEYSPGLESLAFNLAVRGLQDHKIEGEALRRGMRTEVSNIVNETPFGMFNGLFKILVLDTIKAIRYGMRGGFGLMPRLLGELPIYDGDDPEVKEFKREFRARIFAARRGSREAIEWLLTVQAKANQQ